MDFWTVIVIGVGLSMDAFAVAIASGVALRDLRLRQALRIAGFFGAFQAIMPVIGWLAGLGLRQFIREVDHWVAFGLLAFIGGKMIWEAFQLAEAERKPEDILSFSVLFLLAIATSIDALAVGLSLSFLNTTIAAPALLIGGITFTLSLAGVYLGQRCGGFLEKKMEILGGVILIGIGLKILVEHLGE